MKWFVVFLCLIRSLLLGHEYITAYGFRDCADFVFESRKQPFSPEAVKDGDVIYVKADLAHSFLKFYHPRIAGRYILITHFSDVSMPGKSVAYLDDDKLIAWFAQNVEGAHHPKLIPIPIGLQVEKIAAGGDQILDQERLCAQDTAKEFLLYMNFSRFTKLKERMLVFKQFSNAPYCTVSLGKDFRSYLKDLAKTHFVLSPPGLGLDCFRTWEALYMGAVPIVRRSAMDSVFDNLPVLIVDRWEEIDERFLEKKWGEIQLNVYSEEKLWMSYWRQLINSYRLKK